MNITVIAIHKQKKTVWDVLLALGLSLALGSILGMVVFGHYILALLCGFGILVLIAAYLGIIGTLKDELRIRQEATK